MAFVYVPERLTQRAPSDISRAERRLRSELSLSVRHVRFVIILMLSLAQHRDKMRRYTL